MSSQIEVEIFGQSYTIKGEADGQYVSELARYVDSKMRDLAKTAQNMPVTKLALLAAINITHELLEVRREKETRETLIGRKTKDLIEGIEEEFGDLKLY